MGRTNPTSTMTAREFVAAEQPRLLDELDDLQLTTALAEAERQGLALARRLGVDVRRIDCLATFGRLFSLDRDGTNSQA